MSFTTQINHTEDEMKKILITITVLYFITLSTANAFVFRGVDYKWGTNKIDVMNYESMIPGATLVENNTDNLVYQIQSEWGPAEVIYKFKDSRLSEAGIVFNLEDDFMTNYIVYHRIKKALENSIGKPLTEKQYVSAFKTEDAFITIVFDKDAGNIVVVLYQQK